MSRRKAADFSPVLRALDDAAEAYRAGGIPIGDYLRALAAAAPLSGFPQASLFVEALMRERALDFRKVEAEKGDLLRGADRENGGPRNPSP